MLFKILQKTLINIIIYLSLLTLLQVNKNIIYASGLIGQKSNLEQYTEQKSKYLIQKLEYQNLAVNFISNKRTLNEEEKIAFQSSGLVHLLAVSGAQIIPVCGLMSYCMMQIIYSCLRKHHKSSSLMKILFYFKHIIVISISFVMTGLFSCTGALLRVTFLSSLNDFLKSQKYLYHITKAIPFISNGVLRRFILLFLLSILFGNIFFDYSFLLSSIGACILEITALSLNIVLKKTKINQPIKNFLTPVLLSFCTSFMVSILLFPVSRVSLFLSSISNIFAAPVVTFIVTPLSLLLIFIPQNFFLNDLILNAFDHSLALLNFIAYTFQDPNYDIQIPKILLFSYEGKIYLVLILILLFSFIDAVRARDEEYLQYYFKSNGSNHLR